MGRVANNRRHRKGGNADNKQYKKQARTRHRRRDVDQIQDDLKREKLTGVPMKTTFEPDDDLPGLGQHYCIYCARHFNDEATLEQHTKTKDHKKQKSKTMQKQYTQEEAEWGAGRTKEILPRLSDTERI